MMSRLRLAALALVLACHADLATAPATQSTSFTVHATFVTTTAHPCALTPCPVEGAEVVTTCGTAITDALGNASFSCAGSTISGTVYLRTATLRMVNAAGAATDQAFSGAGGGTVNVPMPNDTTAFFFTRLVPWDKLATSRFGYAMTTQVVAQPMPEAWVPGACGFAGAVGCYRSGSPPRLIFSDFGFTAGPLGTVSHEYGHAYHDLALEPFCTTSNPGNRCWEWREGWADFLGAFVNDQYPDDWAEQVNPTWGQGVLNRSRITAFLTDIVDSAGTYDGIPGDDDSIVWTPKYLASLVRTCSVKLAFLWITTVGGIDHLIDCLQHDAYARNSAPAGDRPNWLAVNAYSESAKEPSGWSAAKVKQLWLFDLYDQGSLP